MLSQSTGYAIVALTAIAREGGRSVLVRDIACATGMPGPYLSKIVHVLARRGLVVTQRGVGGGVTLARPGAEISLFDIAAALEDSVLRPSCMLGSPRCDGGAACSAHEFWTQAHASILTYLRQTSLTDLLGDGSNADDAHRAGQCVPRVHADHADQAHQAHHADHGDLAGPASVVMDALDASVTRGS